MHRLLPPAPCALVLSLAACSSGGAGIDLDGYDRSASAVVATESSLALADDVLGLETGLDPTRSADENAMAAETRARDALTGCGTISRTATSVTIDFGTTGCTTPSGHQVTGALDVFVAVSAGQAQATLTFHDLALDGMAVSGTLDVATLASAVEVAVALESASLSVMGTVTTTVSGTSVTIDGSLSTTRSGIATTLVVSHLGWSRGDCYPSSGTVQASTGRWTQSITFTAASASSGTVSVSEGPVTTTETLPAYGDCPAP